MAVAVATTPDLGVKAFGSIGVDKYGGILLGCAVGLVTLLWSYFRLRKYLAGRGRMDSVSSGQLRLAAARGRVEDLELLSTLPGFEVDADLLGFTPLHATCVQGHAAAAMWLLDRGADITRMKYDDWRDTCMHYAAGSGSVDTVQVLLAYGADPAQPNALDTLPADVATRAGYHKMAKYLRGVADGSLPRPTKEQAAKRFRDSANGSAKLSADGASEGSPKRGSTNGSTLGANGDVEKGHWVQNGGDKRSDKARKQAEKEMSKAQKGMVKQLVKRGFEGWGTPGTKPKNEAKFFRPMSIVTQVLGGVYLTWRALRTLWGGYGYFYSIPFWLAEFMAYCLSYCFVASLFYMIERPERRVEDMLDEENFPMVDVYICTYSEPVEIVEPTTVAALNLNWPGSKLTINILDDGKRPEMARLVRRLAFQCKWMRRDANIAYIGRDKKKGVPHHAKAGNINSCLLKEGPGKGDFILVLDCDMIAEPDFLQKTVGHFYTKNKAGEWVTKDKAAFIQTPQDFFNVDAADPMVHCARFFYGPMLQGRDGIGACPCCGTGVVFRRDVLVSIGGQAYGSITEDYNTAMTLMSAGMATMYLNERLVYGMAPDEIADVMTQRLRWAMGALQILMKDNPLRLVGLTNVQSLLFFEAAAHHYLAITTIFMAVVPIIFLFTQVSPMVCAHLWEFTLVFGSWYLSNRIMMWFVHRGTVGGSQELWRGSQMWVWMAPNHIKAIWKVLIAENPIIKKLFNFEIGFTVTSKDKQEESRWAALKKALSVTWPHLLYYFGFAAGIIYFIVTAALGYYTTWQVMVYCSAIAWGMLIVLCIFPPIYTMFPRVETELGWKIVWDPFADPTTFGRTTTGGSFKRRSSMDRGDVGGEKSMLSGLWSNLSVALPSMMPGRRSRDGRSSVDVSRASADGSGGPRARPSVQADHRSMMLSHMPATIREEEEEAEAPASAPTPPPAAPAGPRLPTWGAGPASLATSSGTDLPSLAASRQGSLQAPNVRAVSFQATASVQQPMSIFAAAGAPAAATTASPFGAAATTASPFGAAATTASPFGAAATSPFQPAAGAPSGGSGTVGATSGGPSAGHVGLDVRSASGSVNLVTSRGEGGSSKSQGAFSNIGRVALKRRTADVLRQSALLTSVVLPERLPGQRGASLLLDGHGNVAPGGSLPPEQSMQLSMAFASGEPGKMSGGFSGGASGSEIQSVSLPLEQSLALTRLNKLTGADVSVVLPPLREGRSMLSSGDLANVSLAPGQMPTIASPEIVAQSMRALPSPGRYSQHPVDQEEADAEAALVDELASEPGEAPPVSPRVAAISHQLVEIASALSPANASMLLDGGGSMVVPVLPQSIYEHTLVARPNFRNKEDPGTSYMFLLVNGALLGALIAGSVLDVKYNNAPSDLSTALGLR